jgi:hypothetical protein
MAIAESGGTLTDRSGTITAGGTAQVLAAANTARRYLRIQNQSAGVLWVRETGTAAASGASMALKACTVAGDGTGGAFVYEGLFVCTSAISIFGAVTGQAFHAVESS